MSDTRTTGGRIAETTSFLKNVTSVDSFFYYIAVFLHSAATFNRFIARIQPNHIDK